MRPAFATLTAALSLAFRASLLGLFVALAPLAASAQSLIDSAAVAEVLRKPDGVIAHIEGEYNDIFLTKERQILTMAFRRMRSTYVESSSNLSDLEDLPIPYTQLMTIGLLYPNEVKRIVMVGLGAGSTTTYLAHYLRDTAVDTVELDPAVISAAKKYFGLVTNERVRLIANDGRVFLLRNKEPYDLIMLDAFRGGYQPFHLLTREFYTLVKERLTPTGAAVLNLHAGTQLYVSTIKTLRAVFPRLDLYTFGDGNVIAVASAGNAPDDRALMQRAIALQAKHSFRYSLVKLLNSRTDEALDDKAPLLTDDFAPVQVLDAIQHKNKRRW